MVAHARSEPLWCELARLPVTVDPRWLWPAIVDAIEHPERYLPHTARAEVVDQDAQVVLRRTWPGEGEPYLEWVRYAAPLRRMEVRRRGARWSWAQGLLQSPEGAFLVLQVSDVDQALTHGGIDAHWALHVLTLTHRQAQRLAAKPGPTRQALA